MDFPAIPGFQNFIHQYIGEEGLVLAPSNSKEATISDPFVDLEGFPIRS